MLHGPLPQKPLTTPPMTVVISPDGSSSDDNLSDKFYITCQVVEVLYVWIWKVL